MKHEIIKEVDSEFVLQLPCSLFLSEHFTKTGICHIRCKFSKVLLTSRKVMTSHRNITMGHNFRTAERNFTQFVISFLDMGHFAERNYDKQIFRKVLELKITLLLCLIQEEERKIVFEKHIQLL